MKQTILVIIVSILVVVALGVGAYVFILTKESPVESGGETPAEIVDEPLFPGGDVASSSIVAPNSGTSTGVVNFDDTSYTGSVTTQSFSGLPEQVAGYTFVSVGTTTAFVVAERSQGHLYVLPLGAAESPVMRVSNATIRGLRAVWFGGDKKSLYLAYQRERSNELLLTSLPLSQLATSSASSTNATVTTIAQEVLTAAVSPDQSTLFYLKKVVGGGVSGHLYQFSNKATRLVFESPFSEWVLQWPNTQNVILTTKAAASADGYAYTLDLRSGTLKKLVGKRRGLSTLGSPTLRYLLFSETSREGLDSEAGLFDASLLTTATGDELPLGIHLLPEKCVWEREVPPTVICGVAHNIPQNEYPDRWYRGEYHFNDSLYRINLETGSLTALTPPQGERWGDVGAILLGFKNSLLALTNQETLRPLLYSLQGSASSSPSVPLP